MKRIRLLSLILAFVTLSLSFAGCGGSGKLSKNDDSDGRPTGKRQEADVSALCATLEEAKAGDKITLGSWEQDDKTKNGAEAISWTVIRQDVGKALVLCDNVLEYRYFKTPEEGKKYTTCLYKDSDVRAFLTGDFYENAFTDAEKKLILKTKITTYYVEDYQEQQYETEDCVFLLSVDEVTRYVTGKGTRIYGIPSEFVNARFGEKAKAIENVPGVTKAVSWWLRDMGYDSGKAAYVAGYDTKADAYGWDVDYRCGVRPAMWIVYNENDMNGYAKGEVQPKEDAELNAKLAAAKKGDRIAFGALDLNPYFRDGYEDLEWTVLEADDDSLLLISNCLLGSFKYEATIPADKKEDVNWSDSDLRETLNSTEVLDALFTPQEKAKLVKTKVHTPDLDGTWKRAGGPDTDDYLFIPDEEEITKYFPEKADRLLEAGQYWLRNPDFVAPHFSYVYPDGGIGSKEADEYCGVRIMARVKR